MQDVTHPGILAHVITTSQGVTPKSAFLCGRHVRLSEDGYLLARPFTPVCYGCSLAGYDYFRMGNPSFLSHCKAAGLRLPGHGLLVTPVMWYSPHHSMVPPARRAIRGVLGCRRVSSHRRQLRAAGRRHPGFPHGGGPAAPHALQDAGRLAAQGRRRTGHRRGDRHPPPAAARWGVLRRQI